jgi:hypothetical protein
MASKVNTNKNKLLTELCLKQRKKIDKKYSLELNDIIRLLKNIDNSIFNKTECVLWKGYLTKCNNNKSCYVNFYLKKRKLALHRILYINFIDDLDIKYYLKFTCNNPGKCCNINHILKVYNEDITETNINSITNNKQITQDYKPIEDKSLELCPSISGNIKHPNTIEVEITNDINPEVEINISPSKKNLSNNIKITKIDNNTNKGKIIIIFDD